MHMYTMPRSRLTSGRCLRHKLLLLAVGPVHVIGKDLGGGWKEKTNEEGRVVQELKIEAPSFTEEDQYGYNMPEKYRCDSCRAVMFHLDQQLRKRHPKSRRMKEWEFTDLFEETCRGAFEGYGVRLIDGENTLSGPGLKQPDQLSPGSGAIQMGGENWSKRLGEICRKIVFEKVGEEEVYERFHKRFHLEATGVAEIDEPGLSEALCTTELRECVAGPKPPPKPAATDAGTEPKKPKKPKSSKPKTKTTTAKPAKTSSATGRTGGKGDVVDVQTFLRQLAVSHGFTSDEYLASRKVSEWEKMIVAMAGRIFNKHAESEPQSCHAD